jgi:hypothetical protein
MNPDSRKLIRKALGWALVAALLLTGCDRIEALWRGDRCVLSERPIHAATRVRLAVENGPRGYACCLRCAVTYARQTGKTVRIDFVTDYLTHKPLDPEKALYVTGSDVNLCMGPPLREEGGHSGNLAEMWDRCAPSSLAFGDAREAANFQSIHGGRVERFEQVADGTRVVPHR